MYIVAGIYEWQQPGMNVDGEESSSDDGLKGKVSIHG